ncbi:MAG TPA: hypothetical protein VGS78_07690 [Candidatus Sulfotelmatobacter sp.]|nr:hypothetical protein [Candidatus Sulfotelmatobacter sp.]
MTLAIILIIASALGLIFIVAYSVSRSLQVSPNAGIAGQIQPLDLEAFRNLVDPAERDYLRRRLPATEFRTVQRERLRAMAAYIQVAARNAALLIQIGNAALASGDMRTIQAAHQLIDGAHKLRMNAAVALLRIYIAMAWPDSGLAAVPILSGYEHLNGSAMLLGRLQNPAVPVRISAAQ